MYLRIVVTKLTVANTVCVLYIISVVQRVINDCVHIHDSCIFGRVMEALKMFCRSSRPPTKLASACGRYVIFCSIGGFGTMLLKLIDC